MPVERGIAANGSAPPVLLPRFRLPHRSNQNPAPVRTRGRGGRCKQPLPEARTSGGPRLADQRKLVTPPQAIVGQMPSF
jgi:hypothetical protein